MKNLIILYLFFLPGICAHAQLNNGSVTIDTNIFHCISGKPEKYFSLKSLAPPVTFISYGIISLKANSLKSINTELKEEILENNPGFRTSADDYLMFAPAAGAFLLEAAGVKGKHCFKGKLIIYSTGLVIMYVTVSVLKKITHQLRPDGSKYNSFPSGHTADAFMGAEFLSQEYSSLSPWYAVAGYTTAAGTGVLRMYNNKHWFADVITGAGIGILSAKFSYWIFSKMEKKRNLKPAINY